ncbi:MAG: BlaI/MecI/CopY family transcriptional regulator [Nocardioidaceae bacterium]
MPHKPASDRRAPGGLEDEVLATLAATDAPMTTGDVLAQLGDDLAYTTVMTTLTRLYEKGALTRARHGRSYAYTVTRPEERVARSMSAALEDSPDRDLALARFVEALDPADLPVLRRLLTMKPRN